MLGILKTESKKHEAIEYMRNLIVGEKCIHSDSADRWNYCSDCPLSWIGGSRNGESRPSHELSKIMCSKSREYPK